MKIHCVQTKLTEILKKAEKASSRTATLPILSSLFIEAKGDTLTVKATNLEIGIELSLPVKVEEEGSLAISAGPFVSYIASLKGKTVSLSLEGKVLTIESEKQRATFNTLDAAEFPLIPQVEGTSAHIPVEVFRDGIRSVVYASSPSSIKPELSSIYIAVNKGGEMVYVATDSFRLAEKKIQEKALQDFEPLLIPFKNIIEIERLLEGLSGEVEIVFGESQMALIHDSFYLMSRVVEGSFPDYTKILPTSYATKVVVLKTDLIDVLRVATIFSGKFNKVTFEVNAENKTFVVETRSLDIGENRSELAATIEGVSMTVDFNYKYIVDSFQSITSDSVELLFNEGRPLVIRGVNQKDFTYIVMPMNR